MQWRKLAILFVLAGFTAVVACGDEDTVLKDGGVDTKVMKDGLEIDTTQIDAGPQPLEYYYVMIEDLSTIDSATDDGTDIDAVELVKGTASTWAASVESCTLPDESACLNDTAAKGESDAFCGDPVDYALCFSNYETGNAAPYVSLGGTVDSKAGRLIVKMADKIEKDDKLVVYELGNCQVGATCDATSKVAAAADSIKVSVGSTKDGPWTVVLAASQESEHPKIEITIGDLPTE